MHRLVKRKLVCCNDQQPFNPSRPFTSHTCFRRLIRVIISSTSAVLGMCLENIIFTLSALPLLTYARCLSGFLGHSVLEITLYWHRELSLFGL
jgi:hypothetical protein